MTDTTASETVWESIPIGQDLGSYEYVLTQEMLNDYRRVVGNPNAAYPTVAARHCGHLFQMNYPDQAGLTNAGHECEYYTPPIPGKKIIVTGKVIDKYVRRGKPYLIVEARAVDEDDRLLEISRIIGLGRFEEVAKKWS